MNDYDGFLERLRAAESFVIASHYSPDGDAVGSTIALGHALGLMGKRAVLYNRDPIPANLMFLPNADRFVRSLPRGESFDMAVMVDCASRARVSDEFAAHEGLGSLACIDHHKLSDPEADISLLDCEAASTGEVVLRLVRRAGIELDGILAQCIYTTLVVDTGFFRYSTTNSHSFALASELVSKGAEPWTVAKNLEESYPESRLRLLSMSLATLSLSAGGRYASMEVTGKMLGESGAEMEYSDEFATYPRSVLGVEVSALFREIGDGVVKVSLRSKDCVDVAALAAEMGGGGHSRAAGVRIRASMDEARRRIGEAVERALDSVTRG